LNSGNSQKTAMPGNINLYTALAIFVNNAPQLIEGVLDAAKVEDLLLAEETAAKLSLYSNDAQLTDFTRNVNSLIIAAREQKIPAVKNQAENLRRAFEQIIRFEP
jgi:hypothetical protein